LIELGKMRVRYRDAAERYLRDEPASLPPRPSGSPRAAPVRSVLVFYAAAAIAIAATAVVIWVLVV
jgi:hypothetical protein